MKPTAIVPCHIMSQLATSFLVHLQARAFQPSFFFFLAKFHQKEKLETKVLEKKWFWRFSVAKNEFNKRVKIARFVYLISL
jgi:hypothetical protein